MRDKELVSLASSKRSKSSKSTASTLASSKASSKRSKSTKSTAGSSKKSDKKKKKKKKLKSSSCQGKKKKGHDKKQSSPVRRSMEAFFGIPPPEIIDYLDSVFRIAFEAYCDRETASRLDLLEIRLSFRDRVSNQTKVLSTAQKNPVMKHLKKNKKKQQTKIRADRKSTKKKKKSSKKKDGRRSEDNGENFELPSSFSNKNMATIAEMVTTPHDTEVTSSSSDDPRISLRQKTDGSSVAQSSGGESEETPVVDNTRLQKPSSDNPFSSTREDDPQIELLGQGIYADGDGTQVSFSPLSSSNAPKSPRKTMELLDEEAGSLPAPARRSLDEDRRDNETRASSKKNKKKSKKNSKLNMVVKKTMRRVLSSHSKKKKHPSSGSMSPKIGERRNVKWEQLSADGDGKDDELDADYEWGHQSGNRLNHSPGKKKRQSLDGWGGGNGQESSETSDYGMSTYSGLAEAAVHKAKEEEASSSSSGADDSMYIDGEEETDVQEHHSSSDQRDYVITEEEYGSSSKGEEDSSSSSSVDEGQSYYSEESWDEEESYVSPDEEDYDSPDDDENNYTDASEYVSPTSQSSVSAHLQHPNGNDGPSQRVTLNEAYMAESMLRGKYRPNGEPFQKLMPQSAHSNTSYYEEISFSEDEEESRGSASRHAIK